MLNIGYSPENSKIHDPDFDTDTDSDSDSDDDPFSPRPSSSNLDIGHSCWILDILLKTLNPPLSLRDLCDLCGDSPYPLYPISFPLFLVLPTQNFSPLFPLPA